LEQDKSIEFDLECICGCTSLKFMSYPEDKQVCITQYVSNFYVKQNGMFSELWKRIKFAFHILMGKEFYMYDLVIEDEKIAEFKNWVSKI
jgi:hypothetical protein